MDDLFISGAIHDGAGALAIFANRQGVSVWGINAPTVARFYGPVTSAESDGFIADIAAKANYASKAATVEIHAEGGVVAVTEKDADGAVIHTISGPLYTGVVQL